MSAEVVTKAPIAGTVLRHRCSRAHHDHAKVYKIQKEKLCLNIFPEGRCCELPQNQVVILGLE